MSIYLLFFLIYFMFIKCVPQKKIFFLFIIPFFDLLEQIFSIIFILFPLTLYFFNSWPFVFIFALS